MWGLLRIQRNIFRRPLYRIVPAPFVNRRLAHGEKEPYTEGPNGFLFNEKVFMPFYVFGNHEHPNHSYYIGRYIIHVL